VVYPELSPDGRQVVFMRSVQGNSDIWLADLTRGGSLNRLTVDPNPDLTPVWSPDGMRIAFSSNRTKGIFGIYIKSSNSPEPEVVEHKSANDELVQDWSKDGQFLLYLEQDPKSGRDLWAWPMTGNDRKPIPIATTAFEEQNGQFSPNGDWVAYETNESGDFQIVVQPFPKAARPYQVSAYGGTQPRWSADGKELFFISLDGKMMASSITLQNGVPSATKPAPLFPVSIASGLGANRQEYAVSRDGKFLINEPSKIESLPPITVILNWRPNP
jgi:Tol biopolymer transport system component